MYIDEVQHPETGQFHLLQAESSADLEQKIADVLMGVEDLRLQELRGRAKTQGRS